MGTSIVERIESEFYSAINQDPEQLRASQAALNAGLLERGVCFEDRPIPASLMPHFTPAATAERWASLACQLISLLDRVATIILANPDLYNRLGFLPWEHELFAIDPKLPSLLPVCRPDGVYQGERILFVEVNDVPAGATQADHLEELTLSLFPMNALRERFSIHRRARARGMHDAIVSCYRHAGGSLGEPRAAIVGWRDSPLSPERRSTVAKWSAWGTPAFYLDARELSYEGGKLWARGERIDIVNRRFAWRDFSTRATELAPLVQAYRDGAVCIVSPLRSQLVADKSTLALLHDEEFSKVLSEKDRALIRELVPFTCRVDAGSRDVLLEAPDAWVLKPGDGIAGDGLVFGVGMPADVWRNHVERVIASGQRWVAQRLMPVASHPFLSENHGALETRRMFVNWNPFIFRGQYCGGYVRGGMDFCISVMRGGALFSPLEVRDSAG